MTRLSRRVFVHGAYAVAAGLPFLSSGCSLGPFLAPQPRIPRIGYLTVGPRETRADRIDAFLQGLGELGYVQGQTVTIEWRFWSDGGEAELSHLADDLVQSAVNVIVIEGSTQVADAAMRATATIPIVAINVTLPVQTGVVANLGRPGGNVTALASSAPGVASKRVELLRELVPGLAHIVVFVDPANPSNVAGWEEVRAAAEAASIQTERIDLSSAADLETAFETPSVKWAQALQNNAGALLLPVRARLAELAIQHQLPAADINRLFAEAGLLMTYGPKGGPVTQSYRAAVYVDKILKGAKPADLPVQQPTEFDFVVNTRTAAALGLTIPPSVAVLVTEWIG